MLTTTYLEEDRVSLVVARRGTAAGAALRIEGFATGARLAVHDDRAVSTLLVCTAGSDARPRSPCHMRGIDVAGTAISTHAAVAVEEGLPILADPAGGLGPEGYDDDVALRLGALEGPDAEPVGPPITRTTDAPARAPLGLAARLDPTVVVYADGDELIVVDAADERVASHRLRAGTWSALDVAP